MSNYVKATDFAVKDSLTTGDPLKIIKGTELNTEYNLIQTAVATKADLASPNFLGNPTAVTQPTGNSSNRLATTAFVTNVANSLGTMSTQNANAVAITGGSIAVTGSINGVTPGTNARGARTVSTSTPTGGSDGDIWYQF